MSQPDVPVSTFRESEPYREVCPHPPGFIQVGMDFGVCANDIVVTLCTRCGLVVD